MIKLRSGNTSQNLSYPNRPQVLQAYPKKNAITAAYSYAKNVPGSGVEDFFNILGVVSCKLSTD